jgi:hypothetical protein
VKLASAPQWDDEFSGDDDDNSSLENTIVGPLQQVIDDQQTIVSTVPPNSSIARTFQSVTIESQFSEPSIFDNASTSLPVARRVRRTESVTSFATSVAEGNQGQRRTPNLPGDHVYGSAFQCKICGEVLVGIRHRADWNVCMLLLAEIGS